jgi:formylglycine-generating enzyme required for sulfatase activity
VWITVMEGTASKILSDKIENEKGLCNVKISFVDIVAYSQRRNIHQHAVIKHLLDCIVLSLDRTTEFYRHDLDLIGADLRRDVVVFSSGDGAALAFPFDDPPDIHLVQVLELLRILDEGNESYRCEVFATRGWCDCHNSVAVRCGLAEGRVVLYRDLNGNFGMAGHTINIASRVMDLGGAGHLFMTAEAREAIFGWVPHAQESDFRRYREVELKHKHIIDVYQYVKEGVPGLSTSVREGVGVLADTELAALPRTTPATEPGPPATPGAADDLVLVPPGVFTANPGLPTEVEVTISERFFVGRYQVTQQQWTSVMDADWGPSFEPGLPANALSWFEAVDFCNARSKREGLQPVYDIADSGTADSDVRTCYERSGYRLLTEAEWEYCCTAGGEAPDTPLTKRAWYSENSRPPGTDRASIQAVGQLDENGFGLFDMLGNVREWCNDWHSPDFPTPPLTDPRGPETGRDKVLRGGAYNDLPEAVRPTRRHRENPRSRKPTFGFRVMRRVT